MTAAGGVSGGTAIAWKTSTRVREVLDMTKLAPEHKLLATIVDVG